MTLTASAAALLMSALLLPLLRFSGAVLPQGTSLLLLAGMFTATSGAVTWLMALRTGMIIVRLLRTNLHLAELSRIDALSGLLNRRAFADSLARALPGSSLVIVDIDRFKSVNDTHGHAAGDAVIRRIAELIVETAGDTTSAARLGGEEFGFLLCSGDLEQRLDAVETLRARIEAEVFRSERGPFRVTMSAGMAETAPRLDADHVYAAADKALYFAKAGGRNRVIHGSDGLNVILALVGGEVEAGRHPVPELGAA